MYAMLCTIGIHAQVLQGHTLDGSNGAVLPYVNIGIPGKGIGTVSQSDGAYQLILTGALPEDTLRFSMIGYSSVLMTVNELLSPTSQNISLHPDTLLLETVEVRPRNTERLRLGNTYNNPNLQARYTSGELGAEIGTIMKVKKGRVCYVDAIGLNLAFFLLDSAVIRFNVYQLENDAPDILLNREPIYCNVYKDQKQILLDVAKYQITASSDFIVAAEWLTDVPDYYEKIIFCAGFAGAGIRFRETSQDVWQKAPVGIGMWCDVQMEKIP